MSQLLIQKSPKTGCSLACSFGSAQGEHLTAQGVPGTTPTSQEHPRARGSASLLCPVKIPTHRGGGQGQTLWRGCARASAPILGPVGTGTGAGGTRSHAGVVPESLFLAHGTNTTSPPSSAKRVLSPLLLVILGQSRGKGICPLPPHPNPKIWPILHLPIPFPTQEQPGHIQHQPSGWKTFGTINPHSLKSHNGEENS